MCPKYMGERKQGKAEVPEGCEKRNPLVVSTHASLRTAAENRKGFGRIQLANGTPEDHNKF